MQASPAVLVGDEGIDKRPAGAVEDDGNDLFIPSDDKPSQHCIASSCRFGDEQKMASKDASPAFVKFKTKLVKLGQRVTNAITTRSSTALTDESEIRSKS